jgi:hypothetical protein
VPEQEETAMILATLILGAIGGGIITYLLTGSVGLAVLVFIVLKLFGR